MVLSSEMKSKVAQSMSLLTPVERIAFTMRHMEGRVDRTKLESFEIEYQCGQEQYISRCEETQATA